MTDTLRTICFYIEGANTMGLLVAAVFFARFWVRTRDHLFIRFSIAFAFMAANNFMITIGQPTDDARPYVYLTRLAAFLLIIWAIVDKNRDPGGMPRGG